MPPLQDQFGQIEIYFFGQFLKGRISPGMKMLDAGSGSGRNLVYPLREGYEVYAADSDAREVDSVRRMAAALARSLPASNFRVEPVEEMSFDDACADVVVWFSSEITSPPPSSLVSGTSRTAECLKDALFWAGRHRVSLQARSILEWA